MERRTKQRHELAEKMIQVREEQSFCIRVTMAMEMMLLQLKESSETSLLEEPGKG